MTPTEKPTSSSPTSESEKTTERSRFVAEEDEIAPMGVHTGGYDDSPAEARRIYEDHQKAKRGK